MQSRSDFVSSQKLARLIITFSATRRSGLFTAGPDFRAVVMRLGVGRAIGLLQRRARAAGEAVSLAKNR